MQDSRKNKAADNYQKAKIIQAEQKIGDVILDIQIMQAILNLRKLSKIRKVACSN